MPRKTNKGGRGDLAEVTSCIQRPTQNEQSKITYRNPNTYTKALNRPKTLQHFFTSFFSSAETEFDAWLSEETDMLSEAVTKFYFKIKHLKLGYVLM